MHLHQMRAAEGNLSPMLEKDKTLAAFFYSTGEINSELICGGGIDGLRRGLTCFYIHQKA